MNLQTAIDIGTAYHADGYRVDMAQDDGKQYHELRMFGFDLCWHPVDKDRLPTDGWERDEARAY